MTVLLPGHCRHSTAAPLMKRLMTRLLLTTALLGTWMVSPGAAAATCTQPFALSSEGRYLVDNCQQRFKLKAVNWYGASDTFEVVSGLDKQPLAHIVGLIKQIGFNGVRLPFSNQMLHRTTTVSSQYLAANPELWNKTPLQVYDAVVQALTDAGVVVILNNHTTLSEWCCGYDANGLWYNSNSGYPQTREQWLSDWAFMASRYKSNRLVAGADLRNEVRSARWNGSYIWVSPNWGWRNGDDWRLVARDAADRMLAINPELLVIVEGINWWGSLAATGGERPHLKPVRDNPLGFKQPTKLMYAAHNYGFIGPKHNGDDATSGGQSRYRDMDRATLFATLDQEWGFVANDGFAYSAPVWVSEFGTGYDSTDPKEQAWFSNIVDYMISRDLDFAYWPLNPNKNDGPDYFGLLTPDWSAVRSDWRTPHLQRLLAASGRTGGVDANLYRMFDYGTLDDNQSATLGDWSSGAIKGTCPDGSHVAGVSRYTRWNSSGHYRALCSDQNFGPLWSAGRETRTEGPSESSRYHGYDWAGGFTKYECASGHYVAGVNKLWWGTSGVLCAKANRTLGNICRTLWFDRGDNRASSKGGDFAPGAYKGQCADNEYVGGVAQRDGAAAALLCCQ